MFYNSVLLSLLYRCTGIKSSNFKGYGVIIFLITHFVKLVALKADILRAHFGGGGGSGKFYLGYLYIMPIDRIKYFC